MRVTVAISTWNRAERLRQTLTVMRELAIPPDVQWELLVVNNNCTDDTDAVLSHHAGHLPLCRLFEPRPGLSNARNCALDAARGDLVLFTDDDVLVPDHWFADYVAAARQNAHAVFFGGPIEPVFETPPPGWLEAGWKYVSGVYGTLDWGPLPFSFDHARLPFGANFGLRADVARRYRFDAGLGRRENQQLAGEETALFTQMLDDGWQGRWVPGARLGHVVPKEHLTPEYLRERFFGLGQTAVRIGLAAGLPPYRLWRRALIAEVKSRVRSRWGKRIKWVKSLAESSYLWGQLAARRAG